jgi:two-component system, sensor histidine kinase RegB
MSLRRDENGLNTARQPHRAGAYAQPARVPQTATTDLAPNLALPWVLRLRYGMVAGEAAIIVAIAYVVRLDFPVLRTLAPLAVILASNVLLGRMRNVSGRFPQETLGVAFVLDTLSLTVMLGLTGGPNNPFSLLYLVQITLSAIVLRKFWTWVLGALSTVCFGLLFFFNRPLAVFQSHHVEEGLSPHLIGMWIAFVIAAALITFFTGKIADALRRREQEVLELQDQVSRHERLASMVTLAAGAAHELGTPLGTIAVVARELERYASNVSKDNATLEDARLIRSEVDRCRIILERMSAQGAQPMGETPERVRLLSLLTQVCDQFPESQRAVLRIDLTDEALDAVLPVQATAQSIAALIQNALDANIDQRAVQIGAAENGSTLQIFVQDRGHGMSDGVLRRIAEPFFTTKEPGKGMGLGTFLVRTFAQNLGGRILFVSSPGEGTTATLELPLIPSSQIAHASL